MARTASALPTARALPARVPQTTLWSGKALSAITAAGPSRLRPCLFRRPAIAISTSAPRQKVNVSPPYPRTTLVSHTRLCKTGAALGLPGD